MIFSTNKAFIFIALAVTSPNTAIGSHNHLRSNQQQDQRTLLDADEAPITGSPTNISGAAGNNFSNHFLQQNLRKNSFF